MYEEWRAVNGFPDYEVSSRGRVRSWKNGRWGRRDEPVVMALCPDNDGYLLVSLYNGEGCYVSKVHHLVLKAFAGLCPEGMQARHLDDDPANNHVGNLCWGTSLENSADRSRHGRTVEGENHWQAVIPSDDAIAEIEARYAGGESAYSIAKDFEDLSEVIVRRIAQGTHWSVRGDR